MGYCISVSRPDCLCNKTLLGHDCRMGNQWRSFDPLTLLLLLSISGTRYRGTVLRLKGPTLMMQFGMIGCHDRFHPAKHQQS
jgi:hypothetical protein